MLTSALDLNPWVFREILSPIASLNAATIYAALVGYSLLVNMIFWGSQPCRAHRWAVIISWPICTTIFYLALDKTISFSIGGANEHSLIMLISGGMALPALCSLILRCTNFSGRNEDPVFETRLRYVLFLSLLFTGVPYSALELTISLHPMTYDLYALHWDGALGLNITKQLISICAEIPGIVFLAQQCYRFAPLVFLAVALLHLKKRPAHTASGMLTWVVLTTCAMIAYNFFPITGPAYVFNGAISYVDAIANPTAIPLKMTMSAIAPRNGMPSMHFGWMLAASILWWSSHTKWWSRTIVISMTVLTAIATICMGEHYVVDLIVAVPFVLAAIAASTINISWRNSEKYLTVALGFLTWFLWTIILKTMVGWTQTHLWFGYFVLVSTAIVVLKQTIWLKAFAQLQTLDLDSNDTSIQKSVVASDEKTLERKIALMFFASGAAALIYQVLFAKKLALVFGSTSTATLTVLATFLGGMAIGSLIGGKLAQRTKHPIRSYAIVEGGIAAYCVLTPSLFDLVQGIYISLATGYPADAAFLLPLRVILGATVLLIPTVLMGITLPLLAKALEAPGQRLGNKIGLLYFMNTAGAATGALLTSYAIIPAIGVGRTTLVAALLNLFVALAALELGKRLASTIEAKQDSIASNDRTLPKPILIASLFALGIGGILSLGLEVIYVHMLSIVAGNSVYAFGLMLSTFLLGLAAGGEAARRSLSRFSNERHRLLAASFLGLSVSIALSLWFWNEIPQYFASYSEYHAARSFVSREAIRGGICALIMFPPTFFIGAAYVLAMDLLTGEDAQGAIRRLGFGAAINTLGNIVGVLLFGFVILPVLGGFDASKLLAASALVMALAIIVICKAKLKKLDFVVAGVALICSISAFQAKLDYAVLSSGANVYFTAQNWGSVIEHAESIDGGLTSVTQQDGQAFKTLLTNGKFQGNNDWKSEMQAQIGLAFTPLLHHEKRDKALVIGYGTGVTSRVFHDAGFKQLDIAELSGDVVKLANKHFGEVNNRVTDLDQVKLHVTDGRNFLLLSPPSSLYDVVSIEISSIWFSGASSLYNKEFYQLIKTRLAKDGVLQQWVQLHHLSPTDILTVIATLREEFEYVTLYEVGFQGILIATNDPAKSIPSQSAIEKLETTDTLGTIRHHFLAKIGEIPKSILIANAEVDQYIKGVGVDRSVWISTDDNLMLEYSTPKGNVNDHQKSTILNRNLILKFKNPNN